MEIQTGENHPVAGKGITRHKGEHALTGGLSTTLKSPPFGCCSPIKIEVSTAEDLSIA